MNDRFKSLFKLFIILTIIMSPSALFAQEGGEGEMCQCPPKCALDWCDSGDMPECTNHSPGVCDSVNGTCLGEGDDAQCRGIHIENCGGCEIEQ